MKADTDAVIGQFGKNGQVKVFLKKNLSCIRVLASGIFGK
jgi:hypothetical protein